MFKFDINWDLSWYVKYFIRYVILVQFGYLLFQLVGVL